MEADEYDKSFLQLNPDIAVLTSMDADHLDIYNNKQNIENTFNQFLEKIRPNGSAVVLNALPIKINNSINNYNYGYNTKTDFSVHSEKYQENNHIISLTLNNKELKNISFSLPGEYNALNALAASAVADLLGIPHEVIKNGLESYKGVERRFDYRINSSSITYIDDYAHHPNEIKACIEAVKTLFPNKKITGIFQPHLFTRTRDFLNDFALNLSMLDEVILLPIYPAREKPIPGITSELLLKKITIKQKSFVEKQDLLNKIKSLDTDILLTLGAGDIDRFIIPIEELLKNKLL